MSTRLMHSVLLALVLLATAAPLALARAPLSAAATRTVSGQAVVIAQDFFWKPPHRFVFVRTANGSTVNVQYSSKAQIAGLHTGSAITVIGDHSPLAGLSGGSLAATDIQKPEAAVAPTTLERELDAASVSIAVACSTSYNSMPVAGVATGNLLTACPI